MTTEERLPRLPTFTIGRSRVVAIDRLLSLLLGFPETLQTKADPILPLLIVGFNDESRSDAANLRVPTTRSGSRSADRS